MDNSEKNDTLIFHNVKEPPFRLYGLYRPQEEGAFRRLPEAVAAAVSPAVETLGANTSGGRVRFLTDSARIAIRAAIPEVCRLPHMPLTGTAGFDLYETTDGRTSYVGTFMPPVDMESGYSSELTFAGRRRRDLTIYFPLYSPLSSLEIGLERDAATECGSEYAHRLPVVYYGSSITQGGCVSRPGNSYPAIISGKYDCDFINLGFSGGARGEPAIAEYIAGLSMKIFVCDYDHNAPDPEHLARTLPLLLETVRKAQPELQIFLLSRPDFSQMSEDDVKRRCVVFDTYRRRVEAGDTHIGFIDGQSLFQGEYRDCCTVDGCHPNDLGMTRMADFIGGIIHAFL